MGEGLASSKLQFEGRIQVLEKELSRYVWANQVLNQRLSNLSHPGQSKGEETPAGQGRECRLSFTPEACFHLPARDQVQTPISVAARV